MRRTIAPVLAILILLLAMACQGSDNDAGESVDQRVNAALAAVPTITPQPTATPQPTTTPQADSVEKLEATIESLMGRLATAESALLTQEEKLLALIDVLGVPEPVVELTGPVGGSIVIAASDSRELSDRCYQHRASAGGTGNTFLVEWAILGKTDALCFNPIDACVKEAVIGEPLPRSCIT